MRVGIGYDSHRFAAGRKLILGGVEITHPLGLAGHSDADAVAHALTDAILGAAGLARGSAGGGVGGGVLAPGLEPPPRAPLSALVPPSAPLENFSPPVPADTAVALGAFLAGRGTLDPWAVFGLTWTANVGSGAVVYFASHRFGRPFFQGKLGRRLLSEHAMGHIEREYRRHGGYGIFVSRLLPVWRGVVMPFAGLAGVSAPRALVPLALAAALWYGLLTYAVVTLGANLDAVLALLRRANHVLGVAALAATVARGGRVPPRRNTPQPLQPPDGSRHAGPLSVHSQPDVRRLGLHLPRCGPACEGALPPRPPARRDLPDGAPRHRARGGVPRAQIQGRVPGIPSPGAALAVGLSR